MSLMNRSFLINWTDAYGACSVGLVPVSSVTVDEIQTLEFGPPSTVEELLARFALVDDREPAPEPDTSEMVPRPGDFGEWITSESDAKQRELTFLHLLPILPEKHMGTFKVRQ